jgi:steroid delta-isomerase-like uncharacterized protein
MPAVQPPLPPSCFSGLTRYNAPPGKEDSMTREDIAAIFERRRIALERHDLVALMRDYADDCVVESPSAGVHSGKKSIADAMDAVFTALNPRIHQQTILIDGDLVAVAMIMEGKDHGEFLGLPPTGKSFRVPVVSIFTLKDCLIVHERRIYDFTGLLLQVGLLKAKPAV